MPLSNGKPITWFLTMPKKTVIESSYITVDDRRVNLYIHTEMRRGSRVSIGRKGVTIRLPKMLPAHLKEQQVQSFTKWAIDTIRKKPDLLPPPINRIYRDGYSFTLQGKTFTLFFGISKNKDTIKAKLLNSVIYFSIPEQATEERLQKAIPAMISRVIAKHYHTYLHNKLLELNKLYFGKEIKNFRLKYTHSVWGSCSRQGNINISTRLLFAPDEVVDYVLIHELAHLIHPNHSSRFWNEVARVMPDYQQYDKWLNKNAKLCDF